MKDTSGIALKEWAAAVLALTRGEQIVILRKGGLADRGGGFHLEHEEFFLYPTTEHQSIEQLNPDFAVSAPADFSAGTVELQSYAVVEAVRRLDPGTDLSWFSRHTVWSDAFVQQRLSYKPEKPLHLVLLKVHRLQQPHRIPEKAQYAGCRSWVPLGTELSTQPSTPALSDKEFEDRRRAILERLP